MLLMHHVTVYSNVAFGSKIVNRRDGDFPYMDSFTAFYNTHVDGELFV